MDKNSLHFKGTFRNVYEVNRAYPNGGVDGDYVDINGWQHWWNPDRGTWCVNENRDSYWDEVLSTVQNLLFSKACVSESDFPLNPTDEEKRFGYFYNGELYLWTGTNGTVRNGQYRSFGVVQGERGVGVSSIAQTSTSNVDGGKNEITVTLTNGDSYKFFTYNGTGRNKGYYYRTLDELKQAVPSPTVTDWAIVDGSVYVCDEAGVWKDTTYSWKPIKLNPFVTELNKMDMPTSTGYLYWDGQSFGWKTPVVNNGGGNTGGGTSIDLSEYSWWGRKFDPASKSITGEMSSVTGIEFQSTTNGETVIRKKLHLDKNGDLCFDGNLYATGGITALGSGGGTSGGSGASLGTLLTKLNSENPFPTASGQVLTYDGSNFVWKTSTGSGGSLKPLEVLNKNGSTFFDYNGATAYRLRFGNGLSMNLDGDEYVVTASGGSGSIQVAQTPEYSGESESWVSATKLRFVGITGTKPTIRTNSEKSCVDVGIPVSGGSGASGITAGKLRFYQDGSEEAWNGESDFKIIFGSGLNVTWDSHSQITLSASGGSGGSTSTSVSWSDVTNKPSTFTPSSHTHSTSDIDGLSNYVQGIKVNNAINADKATKLANPRTIWGQSFDGTGNINGNLYMSSSGNSIQLWMNNGNMLDRTDNTLHIGYGLKESSDGEISLDAYVTRVYTDNLSRHYDFKSNVFDVNTNAIHFGSGASGGKISWDRTNNAFKIEGNVYATGGITALGVSNNATTSNNVDFTFKNVTAKSGTFENLSTGLMMFQNGAISYSQCYFSLKDNNIVLSAGNNSSLSLNKNLNTFTLRILSDIIKGFTSQGGGALSLNNVEKLIFGVTGQYGYSRYKFDIDKAISAGILVSTTETFSDEEADDTTVVASESEI
nr:MAG TPA: hypothetical protein [Caudoviricetes sp.]